MYVLIKSYFRLIPSLLYIFGPSLRTSLQSVSWNMVMTNLTKMKFTKVNLKLMPNATL